MNWVSWARLVRIPTVFTVLADVSAAYLLVAGGIDQIGVWLLIVLAGVCLYWSGMIFNDLFDIDRDRVERPQRPLPAEAIASSTARIVAIALMMTGIVAAGLSGVAAGAEQGINWLPPAVAVALAVMILLYDGPLKQTPLGPVAMGICRFLSFLLGVSPIIGSVPLADFVYPPHVLVAALGMGVYVMGVTLVARREATETSRQTLVAAIFVIVSGCVLMGITPRLAGPEIPLRFRGDGGFALLIGMLGFTVVFRVVRLFSDPAPARVQMTVKLALLTLIPLAASFALLGAGAVAGLSIFALIIPAIFVSSKFRMT
jgi:4-hydroxybenzoate polyprenyltransferase